MLRILWVLFFLILTQKSFSTIIEDEKCLLIGGESYALIDDSLYLVSISKDIFGKDESMEITYDNGILLLDGNIVNSGSPYRFHNITT